MVQVTFEVTTQNFQQRVLQAKQPVLVEFGADWCPPCKMLAPVIHALATKYQDRMQVGEVDSDAHPDLVQHYGVMGLPTLILFVNGKPVQRMVGYQPRERVEAQLIPHLQPQNA